MQPENPEAQSTNVDIVADEMLMLMAYRRCSPWRRTAIRMVVQALSADDTEPPGGDVIPFPRSANNRGG